MPLLPAGDWLGLGGGKGTPKGVGSPESAQADDGIPGMEPAARPAKISSPAPSTAADARHPFWPDTRRIGLLQGQPVIRDLQFHLLRRGRQLIGAKEDDPAQEDHDDDTNKAEKWLAHV